MVRHFIRIWYRPRETVRAALDTASSAHVHGLAACFGVVAFLDNAVKNSIGETLPLHWILVLAIFAGPLAGILALYFFSFLLRWTGILVRGRASLAELRTALAYSWIPILWFAPIYVVTTGIYGREAFIANQTSGFGPYPFLTGLMVGLFPIWMTLGIWIVVIGLQCLSEAQGFSLWRATLNAMLAFTVLVVAVVAATIAIIGSVSVFS